MQLLGIESDVTIPHLDQFRLSSVNLGFNENYFSITDRTAIYNRFGSFSNTTRAIVLIPGTYAW